MQGIKETQHFVLPPFLLTNNLSQLFTLNQFKLDLSIGNFLPS